MCFKFRASEIIIKTTSKTIQFCIERHESKQIRERFLDKKRRTFLYIFGCIKRRGNCFKFRASDIIIKTTSKRIQFCTPRLILRKKRRQILYKNRRRKKANFVPKLPEST